MENVEVTRTANLLGWLEEEQHQTKAHLGRIQHQLEQLASLYREQAVQIRATQDELASARNQLAKLTTMDELLRGMRESIARLQLAYTEHLQETDKEEKKSQAELDKVKQAISEFATRIDSMYNQFEPLIGKVQSTTDVNKRQHEIITELSRNVESMQRQTEVLLARTQVFMDQSKRSEGEIDRVDRQLTALQSQDDVILARYQILADHVKQIDAKAASLQTEEQLRLDLTERFQILKLEHKRLDKQVSDIVPMIDVYGVRLDEQNRELRQIEERRQLTGEDLKDLKQLLLDHTSRLEGYIVGVQEMEQRHRRRQVVELELQANELKDRIAKLKGRAE